ncbi:hypothetical protein CLIM01_14210 [Colletotrichum limetticola]|uniref:Uncharacterized protein n=1 Tax=Colletotrichum limetticola TaxID=1209924 RepID=A0ABQ9PA69_9PEZI|nr:hypothetical protein CLIM01_14210 [Colletotrichum limetticola]
MGERTGSRVFQWVWSYVMIEIEGSTYIARSGKVEMDVFLD